MRERKHPTNGYALPAFFCEYLLLGIARASVFLFLCRRNSRNTLFIIKKAPALFSETAGTFEENTKDF
jgi:hypothetical protein